MYESDIEQVLIDMLVELGYDYHYGPDIAPFSNNPWRTSFEEVILTQRLRDALTRLNPDMPERLIDEALGEIQRLGSDDLLTNNEKFHRMITDGVELEEYRDGEVIGQTVQILDVTHPERNSFDVVNQFVVKSGDLEKRPDVILFINGLPLVTIELKNAVDADATLERAWNQIQTYKSTIPQLFYYNALCILSDGIDAGVSSLSAPYSRFLPWHAPETAPGIQTDMQTMTEHLLRPETLLSLIRYGTVFEAEEFTDAQGVKTIQTIKKVAAYHQYYAVQKAVQSTYEAINGDRKVGVIRHTQGSGKSLSMVFYVGQIVVDPKLGNPTILVITDRNDLDDQLFGVFAGSKSLLRQTPAQAQNRRELKELLKVAGGGIVFSTIQKFMPESGNVFETLSERENIIVIADEAHRSQYGFGAKEVTTAEGSEIRYGNAKYLRDALPNASFIGFTGTPIEQSDRSTRAVFGDEIDVYDIQQAVQDGATVPLSYESRLVKIKVDPEAMKNLDYAIDEMPDATTEQKEQAKTHNAHINAIVGNSERLYDVANDIVTHFEARQQVLEGKAMIVVMTRQIAVDLYDQIISLRPGWEDKRLDRGALKVVMTSSSDDPASFQVHRTNKSQRKELADRLKNPDDELKLVIVQGMRLTGFDAPVLNTMYIDKKMRGANLMQAIARVNRVYKDKPGGLIVDYIGIGQDLRDAMQIYTQAGGRGESVSDISETIAALQTQFEIIQDMFASYDYQVYFDQDPQDKLTTLLDATNFILAGKDELKARFLTQMIKLSKLFALATPSYESEQIRDEVAFFQAIQSRIHKRTSTPRKLSDAQVNAAVKQIVDDALSTDGVIDIFQAAGLKQPTLDILSEEFLLEVKNMKQQFVALELLRKLLNEDIKLRQSRNIAQAKKFSEMLKGVIAKYHNNQIDTAKVIQELSDIAREIKASDKKAEELGLTVEEYAFYTVLSDNESTKFLEDDKMKELIHRIVDIVRNTKTTMDRDKREDIRARLRLTVKKLLQRYGYPPDLARMEADRVLEQSEAMAGE